MDEKTVPRIGVIGVGYLGRLHAQKLAGLSDIRFAGVYDADGDRGRSVAEEFSTSVFRSHRRLLDEVDAVTIAVPTTAHYRVAMDAMRKGVHVLLEKPVTSNLRQARALVREAEKRGLVFQVGHVERFNPAMLRAASLLAEPRFIECHRMGPFGVRGTDVDVVLDLMIHDIDLILSMVRSPVKRVSSVGVPVLTPNADIANARIDFADGCVANVTASRVSTRRMRKIRVFQEDAYISIDFLERSIQVLRRTFPQGRQGAPEISGEVIEAGQGDSLRDEIRAFVDRVRDGGRPLVSGREGLEALEVAFRIRKAMRGH